MSISEIPYRVSEFLSDNDRIIMGATSFLVGSAFFMGAVGGKAGQTVRGVDNSTKPNGPAAGLPTKSPEPVFPQKVYTFRGISYSPVPNNDFPVDCATAQVTRYLMSEQQLNEAGKNRGDQMYMRKGQGVGRPDLAWGCAKNGKRVLNPAPAVRPGQWH